MRRSARFPVVDLSDVTRIIADVGARSVILDLQPIVAGWSDSEEEIRRHVNVRLAAASTEWPSVTHLLFASNAKLADAIIPTDPRIRSKVVAHALKPWRLDYVRDLPSPLIVAGDQTLTDGVLAWRISAPFIHWVKSESKPWWPRSQQILGLVLTKILFRTSHVGLGA